MDTKFPKLLNRTQVSEFCQARNLSITPKTLANYASLGTGPAYVRFGGQALYSESDLLNWLNTKIGNPAALADDHRKVAR